MISYSKAWETMNDLDMVTSKVTSVKEILDVALEALEKHDYNKAEALMYASCDFIKYYLEEHDDKFKKAWDATVTAIKKEEYDATIQDKKYQAQYTDEELEAMCDAAEEKEITDREKIKQHSEHYYDYKRNDPDRENPFKTTLTINDDGVMVLPDELLERMNLGIGDYIQWNTLDDYIVMKKVDNVSIVEEVK
jgi:hypothetical protein